MKKQMLFTVTLLLIGEAWAQFNNPYRFTFLTQDTLQDAPSAENRSIVVDDCDNIHTTYQSFRTVNGVFENYIYYGFKPVARPWYGTTKATPALPTGTMFEISVDKKTGKPYIVYVVNSPTFKGEIFLTELDPNNGFVQQPITQNGYDNQYPTLEVDQNGNVHAAWLATDTNFVTTLLYAVRQGGTWTAPTRVDTVVGAVYPQLALDENGQAWIATRVWDTISNSYDIHYATNSGSAAPNWKIETIRIADTLNEFGAYPAVRDGKEHLIVYTRYNFFDFLHNYYMERNVGSASWSAPVDISPVSGLPTTLNVDADGYVHTVINRVDEGGFCGLGSWCWISGYALYASNKTGTWQLTPVVDDVAFTPPFEQGEYFNVSVAMNSKGDAHFTSYYEEPLTFDFKTHEVRMIDTDKLDTIDYSNIGQAVLPNVFTPNNDGVNDTYGIIGGGNFVSFNLTIYNRWGMKVFESETPADRWDGKVNEQLAPDGVYYAHLKFSVLVPPDACTNPATEKEFTRVSALSLFSN